MKNLRGADKRCEEGYGDEEPAEARQYSRCFAVMLFFYFVALLACVILAVGKQLPLLQALVIGGLLAAKMILDIARHRSIVKLYDAE